jgi:DnaK suppressor protein
LYFYVHDREDDMNEIGYAFQVLPRQRNVPNELEFIKRRRTFAMNRSRISANRLKKFRRLLLAKRDEVLQGAAVHGRDKADCASTGLPDILVRTADSASRRHDGNKVDQSRHGDKRSLASIEDALARIDAGTYGICDGDGELIERSRLEMLPWTRYCVKCARLAEMGLLSSETSFEELDNNE